MSWPAMGNRLDFTHEASAPVHDDAPVAVAPHENAVVEPLQPRLPNLVPRTTVVKLRALELGFTDFGHVTQNVAGQLPVGILALGTQLDEKLRVFIVQHRNLGAVGIRDVGLDLDRTGSGRRRAELLPGILRRHPKLFRQNAQRFGFILNVFPVHHQAERRPAVHEDVSMAVKDIAARRDNGNLALAVVFGLFDIVLVVHDLHAPQAQGQDDESRHDAGLKRQQPEPWIERGWRT